MLTEKDAASKSCPLFSAVAAIAVTVPSFSFRTISPGNCQGSICMMWRKSKGRDRYFVTYQDKPEEEWAWNPHADAKGDTHYASAKVRVVKAEEFGYCGLAGEPR